MLSRKFRSAAVCTLTASALSLAFIVTATGCGSANLNRIFVSKGEVDSMGSILDRARYQYDQGNFDDALDLTNKALEINPDNEDAVLLAGYIYLSKAGIDPFQLAKKLIDVGDENEASGASLADSSSSDDSTAAVLNKLTSLVNLTAADKAVLENGRDTVNPEYPIPYPSCAEDARSKIKALTYANTAIQLICPFVDSSVKMAKDSRHTCKPTAGVRRNPAKAHFLWAFSHLTEALTFDIVLLFSTDTDKAAKNSTTNMQKRITALDGKTVAADTLIGVVKQIKDAQGKVFPLNEGDDACSSTKKTPQFWSTLNDMSAVTKAFEAIAGMPKKITEPITKAMAEINKIGQTVSDKNEAFTQQKQNLKSQMNKKLGKTIGDKIGELEKKSPTGKLPDEQMDNLCDTYDDITEYDMMADEDKKDAGRPANCPAPAADEEE